MKNSVPFENLLPGSRNMAGTPNPDFARDKKLVTPDRTMTMRSTPKSAPPAFSKTSTSPGLGGQTGSGLHRNTEHTGSTWASKFPQSQDVHGQLPFRPGRGRTPSNPLELVIRTSSLPQYVSCTTWTFYQLYEQYGNISYIHVDASTRQAKIIYRPAPQNISWVGTAIVHKHYNTGGNECTLLLRTWDKNNSMTMCDSPEGNRRYPEQIYLSVAGIDFGVMNSKNSMMVMNTLDGPSYDNDSLQLDLRRKRMLLNFKIKLPATEHSLALTRTFMIQLDIAQMHEMVLVQGRDGCVALIMTVDNPPEVYRKAPNLRETHEDLNNGEWNEYNAWYRQTDINTNPAGRNVPIQLRRPDCILDTARWLTYRVRFGPAVASAAQFKDLCQALADHNVRTDMNKDVVYTHGNLDTSWAWHDSLSQLRELQHSTSSLTVLQGMAETVHLTFPVHYQLEVCLSIGVLHECNMSLQFLDRLASLEPLRAVKILEKAADRKERIFDPQQIFVLHNQVSVVEKQRPGYCAKIPSAVVTPTTIVFSTPVLETSNRVVRHFKAYEDRFLRVKFNDEKHKGGLHSQDDRVMDEIFSRVYRTMSQGITVGNRHYEFLAFGNSQFRDHGAYFFASVDTSAGKVNAASIRDWMGDFTQFNNVAKYISRLGLCFTTTRGIPHSVAVQRIDDVERNGYIFTDGVGKISPFLADLIAAHYQFDYRPSVFQFRMAGCKGVLAVDPTIKGISIQIRPSQDKFPAPYYGLEIAKTSKFTSANLNVQLILVLSSLGISDRVFMTKLRTMLAEMEGAMTSETMARKLLEKNIDYSQMTLALSQAIGDGFMQTQEPFIMSWLRLWRSWSLKYLKEKSRISVEQGAYVFGVTDETGTLRGHYNDDRKTRTEAEFGTLADDEGKPGDTDPKRSIDASIEQSKDLRDDCEDQKADEQERKTAASLFSLPEIFIQVPDPDAKGGYTVIEDICLLTRSPTLHPGDIRVVRAVDVPGLHHLKDCVVLPQTGDRDLANMCSGGDLDGDEYIVSWDPSLIPHKSKWNSPAMNFSTAKPPPREGPVTVNDMAAFFVNHIKNDKLGQIAVAHKLWADREDDGVQNEKCIELAELHSQAVDYPKTGVPAKLPQKLRVKVRPHWSEPRGASYHSKKVIGQLYDAINLDNFVPAWELPFDDRILNACVPSQQNFEDAKEVKNLYDESMRRIMAQYGIKNEFEVFTTFVQEHHQDLGDYKFAETISEVSASLRGQFMEQCYVRAGTTARERDWEKMKPFLVAMYTVTAQEVGAAVADSKHTVERGGRQVARSVLTFDCVPFMSFPWIFGRDLASIATGRNGNGSSGRHVARARPTLPIDKKLARSQAMIALHGELEPLAEVSMPGGETLHMGDVMNLHHDKAQIKSSEKNEEAHKGVIKQPALKEALLLVPDRATTTRGEAAFESAKNLCRVNQEEVSFPVVIRSAKLPDSVISSDDRQEGATSSLPTNEILSLSERDAPLDEHTANMLATVDMSSNQSSVRVEGHTSDSENEGEEEVEIIFDKVPSSLLD